MSEQYVFKKGIGTASNASSWKVCYDPNGEGRYTAEIRFGGFGGSAYSLYEIDKEVFDQVGTFEDDDYKSERLIREKGRCLYRSEVSRHSMGYDTVFDASYREICPWAEIISFDGK